MIAAHVPLTESTGVPASQLLDRARLRLMGAAMRGASLNWLAQALCGLRGHAMMLHFESTRLSLHCASCGRSTPGWAIQPKCRPQS